MKTPTIFRCELQEQEVIVTFSDGQTYAFESDFLFRSRLKSGRLLRIEEEKPRPEF
jgi:hypothetical protein